MVANSTSLMEMLDEQNETVWMQTLVWMYTAFSSIRVPLVSIMCVIGLFSHVLIISVLRHPTVFNPSMQMMISMSVCQMALLTSFLFFTHLYVASDVNCEPSYWTSGWVRSLLLSINLNVVLHTLVVFHVLLISIVRYLVVIGGKNVQWFTWTKSTCGLILVYAIVPCVCLPAFLISGVQQVPQDSRPWCTQTLLDRSISLNTTINQPDRPYQIMFSPFFQQHPTLISGFFWYFALTTKVLPALTVLIISCKLYAQLRSATQKLEEMSSRKFTFQLNDYTGSTGGMAAYSAALPDDSVTVNEALIANRLLQVTMSPMVRKTDSFNEQLLPSRLQNYQPVAKSRDALDKQLISNGSIGSEQKHWPIRKASSLNNTKISQASSSSSHFLKPMSVLRRLSSGSSRTRTRSMYLQSYSEARRCKQYDRSSNLIMLIMMLFLIIELPQSILNSLVAVFGQDAMTYYSHIEDILEAVSIVYSSVNFVLFCGMNSKFRHITFMYLKRTCFHLGISTSRNTPTDLLSPICHSNVNANVNVNGSQSFFQQ